MDEVSFPLQKPLDDMCACSVFSHAHYEGTINTCLPEYQKVNFLVPSFLPFLLHFR